MALQDLIKQHRGWEGRDKWAHGSDPRPAVRVASRSVEQKPGKSAVADSILPKWPESHSQSYMFLSHKEMEPASLVLAIGLASMAAS